jgi:predicted TIM-barrel fold metal-dependent hydrolase
VLRLASYANVHLVLVPNHSAAARAAASTPQAFFSLLAEHFGTDRLMWGSNFPVAWRDHGSIAARLGRMRADLAFLGDAACERIFGGTAENFWPQRGRHGGER